MAKQTNLPGMELVNIRVRLPRATRDKLNVLAALRGTNVNALLNAAINELIASSEELKKGFWEYWNRKQRSGLNLWH